MKPAINQSDLPQTEQAVRLRRDEPESYPMLWKHCSKCGQGQLIACGYNALELSRQDMLGILANIGWTIAPRILCRACSCPMQWQEIQKASALWKQSNRSASGAAMFKAYWSKMKQLYGPQVDKYFMTFSMMDNQRRVAL